MRAIVGVQRHVRGELSVLRVCGRERAAAPPCRLRHPSAAVYADLTVRENLEYFAAIRDAPARRSARSSSRSMSAVRRAGGALAQRRPALTRVTRHRPARRSGTARPRRADGRPRPVLRETLWRLFRSLSERGVTLLVSSHVMDEAARCDEVLLLRDGASSPRQRHGLSPSGPGPTTLTRPCG